jgi:hypothetical protein
MLETVIYRGSYKNFMGWIALAVIIAGAVLLGLGAKCLLEY